MAPQVNMQGAPGGGMVMNVSTQGAQQQQTQHLLQQAPQHRMMARQAAPSIRMPPAGPGPAQTVMMPEGKFVSLLVY